MCAAFVPGKDKSAFTYKEALGKDVGVEGKVLEKRSGSKFLCKMRCDCKKEKLLLWDGKVMVFCSHQAPYWVHSDGTQESIEFGKYKYGAYVRKIT